MTKKATRTSKAKNGGPLTKMQELFCLEYLKDMNATKAAIRAGYESKHASAQGYQLLQNEEIQSRISEQFEKTKAKIGLEAEDILRELVLLAKTHIGEVADWNESGVRFKPKDALTPEQLATIAEVSETVNEYGGSLKIKQYDKMRALELLGKYFKLFTEKLEVAGTDDLAERLMRARKRRGL